MTEIGQTVTPPSTPTTTRDIKYYTASQWQLIWWRFLRHRLALLGGCVLLFLGVCGLFADFLAPYAGTTRDRDYIYGPPQFPTFWDHNGFSPRPFVHGLKTVRTKD